MTTAGGRPASWLQVDGVVALAALGAVLALVVLLGGTIQLTARTLWAPTVAMAIAVLVCVLCRRPWWQAFGEWWPLVLLIALYMQLEPYTRLLKPADGRLLALDSWLLGGSPSERLSPLRTPWLTELFALAYSAYFLLPLGAAAPVYIPTEQSATGPRMRHRERFRALLCAHLLALGIGYLGYILVPARGPRYFVLTTQPLHGALGYYEWAVSRWNAMQEVTFDAFPSLHTANSALAVVHSFANRPLFRPLPWLITPPCVLLVLSTLYLRMHYAVDVLAGLALAAGAAWAAPRLVYGRLVS